MNSCIVDGCVKPRKRSDRYCSMHRARVTRHGSPDVVIAPEDRKMPTGPASPKWTVDPSYNAIHLRLRKARGRAPEHMCRCGEPARQWAFIGSRAPGERLPYGDLSQYEPMCVRCHKRMDMARIREQEAS